MRVYPDSSIVIYLIEQRETRSHAIRARLLSESVVPQVTYTDLTRLECRVWPKRHGKTALLDDFDAFFATPGFHRVPMDATVFDLATDLRAAHGLQTPDALHLAAAISANCDELWTNDNRLANAAAGHIRIVLFNETW